MQTLIHTSNFCIFIFKFCIDQQGWQQPAQTSFGKTGNEDTNMYLQHINYFSR